MVRLCVKARLVFLEYADGVGVFFRRQALDLSVIHFDGDALLGAYLAQSGNAFVAFALRADEDALHLRWLELEQFQRGENAEGVGMGKIAPVFFKRHGSKSRQTSNTIQTKPLTISLCCPFH